VHRPAERVRRDEDVNLAGEPLDGLILDQAVPERIGAAPKGLLLATVICRSTFLELGFWLRFWLGVPITGDSILFALMPNFERAAPNVSDSSSAND